MASAYFKLKMLRRRRVKRKLPVLIETKSEINNQNNNKCRVCLKEGHIPIYSSEGSDISEAVRIFGEIEISEDDKYPKYLCEVCHSLLQGAIIFRKCAKETQILLRDMSDDRSNDVIHQPDFQFNNVGGENSNDSDNEDWNECVLETFDCKLCKLNFGSLNEYILHKNSKQHRQIRVQCPVCHRLFTAHLFKKHLATHQSATHLICDVCGKLYRKDNLVRHLQLHTYDLPFQCQMCPYRGRFMEALKIHMRTHTGHKPFSCDKCELRFLTRSNLNRHLLTHKKEKPHNCVECGRGFYTKRDLDVHFKSDHAGIKDFGCQMCGNKYGTRKALMRHELRVHKRDKMAKGRMPLYLRAEYRKSNVEVV